MTHLFLSKSIRIATFFALPMALIACAVTVIPPDIDSSQPSAAPIELHLTPEIAQRLTQLRNEVHVPNILYVTQHEMLIENIQYTLLSFHTIDQKVYRTRVESTKLNQATFERLKSLKSATFIGVLPIPDHPEQYFFRNYKNLVF